MRSRMAHVAVVLCGIFAAGLSTGCGGRGDSGGTRANNSVSGSFSASDADTVAMAPLGNGDDDDTAPARACTGAPGNSDSTASIILDKKAPGAVLVLKGAARTYELWIRRKLPRKTSITMSELDGNVPGVNITVSPGAPGDQWAVLTFGISDCPASDDYVIAHKADMKSRAGTLDTVNHRVSGWIRGASGYILAQGIVRGTPPDTTSSDSTAQQSR